MSNVSSVTTGATSAAGVEPFSMGGMSPDALLAYCQMQLGGLDKEMQQQMNTQTLELQEREAVESAQTTLESFGTTGPQSPQDFQKCEDAINQAAAGLPAGDPVAAQLTQFGQQIAQQYGYTAPTPGMTDQQMLVEVQGATNGDLVSQAMAMSQALGDSGGLLLKKPANNDWQGTTDTLSNMADGIKSGAEIQMLQLQDLVSQRQQAVQLASGMMSTEDQTLNDEAKNIAG